MLIYEIHIMGSILCISASQNSLRQCMLHHNANSPRGGNLEYVTYTRPVIPVIGAIRDEDLPEAI